MPKLKIGIIGYRNHSLKIAKMLDSMPDVKEVYCYIYKKISFKSINKIKFTNDILAFEKFDAVVIASKTGTHFKYIKKFYKKKIYIYCEKPAVTKLNEVLFLKKMRNNYKKKIMLGHNLLHSIFYKKISEVFSSKKFGKFLYAHVCISNGISYKKNMKSNWRFKSKDIFKNITGNLGIHYLVLLKFLIGKIKKITNYEFSAIKKNRIDNSLFHIIFKNSLYANLFFSYSGVLNEEIKFFFTNAILEFDGKKIFLYYPRDSYDKTSGNFIKPKKKILLNLKKNWSDKSLHESLYNFVSSVKNKKYFDVKKFNSIIDINQKILGIRN